MPRLQRLRVMRELFDFGWPLVKGLGVAARTDVDVFLLTLGGLVLTAFPRPLRGLGLSLLTYVVVRRADNIALAFATKLDRLSQVMADEH